MDPSTSIDKVCEAIGGTYADLAKFLDVTDAAISQWKRDGIPPARALELERRLEGKIRAADLATTTPKKRRAA